MRKKGSLIQRIKKANKDYNDMVKDPSLKHYEKKSSKGLILLLIIILFIILLVLRMVIL